MLQWPRHDTRTGEMQNAYIIVTENLLLYTYLADQEGDRRIILR
jgi:hypothetical protein